MFFSVLHIAVFILVTERCMGTVCDADGTRFDCGKKPSENFAALKSQKIIFDHRFSWHN